MGGVATKRSGQVSRQRLAGAAVLAGGALVVRQLARPRPSEKARLVDFERVRRRAVSISGEAGESAISTRATELSGRFDQMAADLRPWIAEALEEDLHPQAFPPFQTLDRRGWIDVNVALFQSLKDPALKLQERLPASRLTDIGRGGVSEYLGLMLGFLSRRVLGQYDPVLLASDAAGPSALYIVETNVERFERGAEVRGDPVRQWLILHEVTHAWEFEAHPWLREHLNAQIRELVAEKLLAEESPDPWRVLRSMTVGAREQWRAVGRMQAAMSLLEGFSNVVMRRVGLAHLPNHDAIDAQFRRRSADRRLAERAFLKLTGLEMKMQQYEQGEAFCDAVIREGGMTALRRAWSGPEALPSLAEIRAPAAWIRRTA